MTNIIKKQFPIVGMHCASCAINIQRKLRKTAGVVSAEVNYGSEKAVVEYDADICKEEELVRVVASVGDEYRLVVSQSLTSKGGEIDVEEMKKRELEELKQKIVVSGILSLLIFIGSMREFLPIISVSLADPFMQFLMILPVQFWAGRVFIKAVVSNFRNRAAGMDSLIGIGTMTAFLFSTVQTFAPKIFGTGEVYYDTAAVIITLILLGRYLEARAKLKTGEAIKKLLGLQAKTARVVRGNEEVDVPIEEVKVGDLIRIRPGEKVAVDGVIVEGDSTIDEAMISGESMPVEKHKGDNVIGSTINKSGTFVYKATKVGEDTVLAQIVKMVASAQASKAPIARLADVVAGYFVPVVMMVAIATFVWWYVSGMGLSFALLTMIGVLIIACPCALGLATPTAIMVGVGRGAGMGILIRDAESLEVAGKVKAVIFDKTGTLTHGKPEVTEIIEIPHSKFLIQSSEDVLRLAASLEVGSEHPLAEAIVGAAKNGGVMLDRVKGFKMEAGKGVIGIIGTKRMILGNRRLMSEYKIDLNKVEGNVERLENQGKTVMFLAGGLKKMELVGLLAVADTVKDTAIQALTELNRGGIKSFMITGDNRRVAIAVATKLGMSEEGVLAEVMPDEKQKEVEKIQESGVKVAMVGDGVNDSPALAAADVGMAMGSGTDVAIESADITLMNQDLKSVVRAIKLSRSTMRVIKQNLFWAFGYNVILIPVAAGVFYPLILNPMLASIAMAMSSISVVVNALRLKSLKI